MRSVLYNSRDHMGPEHLAQAMKYRAIGKRLNEAPNKPTPTVGATPQNKPVTAREMAAVAAQPSDAIAVTACNGQVVYISPEQIRAADQAIQQATGKISVEHVQRTVARHFKISVLEMKSARRAANIVRPRHIAAYLARVHTLKSLPEIGRRFGDRDHTTILHAVRKIQRLMEKDLDLKGLVDAISAKIKGVSR